jgi:hypothetical protein
MKVNFITVFLCVVVLFLIIFFISRKTREGMLDLVGVTNKGVVDVNRMLKDANNRNNLNVSDYLLKTHEVDKSRLIPFNPSLGNTNKMNNTELEKNVIGPEGGVQRIMNQTKEEVKPNEPDIEKIQNGSKKPPAAAQTADAEETIIDGQTCPSGYEFTDTAKKNKKINYNLSAGNCPLVYYQDADKNCACKKITTPSQTPTPSQSPTPSQTPFPLVQTINNVECHCKDSPTRSAQGAIYRGAGKCFNMQGGEACAFQGRGYWKPE